MNIYLQWKKIVKGEIYQQMISAFNLGITDFKWKSGFKLKKFDQLKVKNNQEFLCNQQSYKTNL